MFNITQNNDETEDKSKHQGRSRSFKHVVGNYPTYVHIPGLFPIIFISHPSITFHLFLL